MEFTRRGIRAVPVRLVLAFVSAGAAMLWVLTASAHAQQIPIAGTTAPQTGGFTPSGDLDITQAEFAGQMDTDAGPGPYP